MACPFACRADRGQCRRRRIDMTDRYRVTALIPQPQKRNPGALPGGLLSRRVQDGGRHGGLIFFAALIRLQTTRNLRKEPEAMEQTKIQIPAEAVEAYTQYIHGEIDRRSFMSRVNKVAVSTVAAAAIVDQLMPNYAAAQQVSPSDSRLKTEYATVPSPNGNGSIKGYLVRPASAGTNKLPSDSRRARESWPQSAHRRRRASPRARKLHGLCAGRLDLGWRLPGRRCEGWRAVPESRSREDVGGPVRCGRVAEVAAR